MSIVSTDKLDIDGQVDDRVLHDFKFFLAYTWDNLNLPAPTPMQFHIADFLQSKEKRLVLQALRRNR